jgi:hypothetical protein
MCRPYETSEEERMRRTRTLKSALTRLLVLGLVGLPAINAVAQRRP